jgi:hypothetical protein
VKSPTRQKHAAVTSARTAISPQNDFDDCEKETGAGEGIRTLDPNLGKVVLYP